MLGLLVSLPLIFAQAPVVAPAAGGASAAPATGGAASAPAAGGATPAPAVGAASAPAVGGAATAPAAAPNASAPSPLSTLLPLLPIPVLFYFLMIRPQQKQEKKRKSMIDSMKRNDRVMTAGGILGTVMSVNADSDSVTLRVDDDKGVKMEFSRTSIVRVVDASSDKKGDA